jgi:uncharacterized protein (UPF0305 family)
MTIRIPNKNEVVRAYCHFLKERVRDLASFGIDEEEINDEETDVILRIIKRTIQKRIKDESNMGRIIHKKRTILQKW